MNNMWMQLQSYWQDTLFRRDRNRLRHHFGLCHSHVPSCSQRRRAATTSTMPRRSSTPLSMPGSTSLSTHASNEPYQTVKGDGRGFRVSSSFAMRFWNARMTSAKHHNRACTLLRRRRLPVLRPWSRHYRRRPLVQSSASGAAAFSTWAITRRILPPQIFAMSVLL